MIRSSSEDEMTLAFLRAEAHSQRFKKDVRKLLEGDLSLVSRDARLDSPYQNEARKKALALFRGYGVNSWLFLGFPADAEWKRVMFTREELAAMKYANAPAWVVLSQGSRVVGDGAANVGQVSPCLRTQTRTSSE